MTFLLLLLLLLLKKKKKKNWLLFEGDLQWLLSLYFRGMFTFREGPAQPSGNTTARLAEEQGMTTSRLAEVRALTARGATSRLKDDGYHLEEDERPATTRLPAGPNTARLPTQRGGMTRRDDALATGRLPTTGRLPDDDRSSSSSTDEDYDKEAPVTVERRKKQRLDESDAESSSSDEKNAVPKLDLKGGGEAKYPQGTQKAIFAQGKAQTAGPAKKK